MPDDELEQEIERLSHQVQAELDFFAKGLDAIMESLETGLPPKGFGDSILCYRRLPIDNLGIETMAEVLDRISQGDYKGLTLIEIRIIWNA